MELVAVAGVGRLLLLLGLSSGIGLPLGMPPLPEDPVMARVAPEECLFYATSAGTAAPDPKSKNQTEQLLAEPEIRQFAAVVEREIRAALSKAAKGQGPEQAALLDDAADLGKTLLTRPAAVYVAGVKVKQGQPPDVRAGVVVNLGDDAGRVKAALMKHQATFLRQAAQPAEIDGVPCYRLNLGPKAPPVTWGISGKYLAVAVGDGEMEALLKAAHGKSVPAWLSTVRKQLPVARPSMVTYLNLKTAIDDFAPLGGLQVRPVLEALGLANVTSLASVTGLDETAVVSRTLLAIDGEPQGVLRLAAEKPLTPADLKPIPADATFALAARLDADKLLDAVLAAAEKIEPRARQKIEGGIEQLPRDFGLDVSIRNDLLRSLGDTWCVYNSPGEGGLVFTGLTAVVQVKDAARFGKAHDRLMKLLRDLGGGRSPVEQYKFAGREIHLLGLGRGVPFAPAWCLTDTELIVALFPQNVKAYLSRDAKFRSLAAVPEMAAAFEADGGPLALAYCDTPKLFELFYPFVPMIAQTASAELRRAGLDVDVSVLPSARAIGPHLRPGVGTVRRTKVGIELTERKTLPGGSLGASAPVLAGLMVPAVHSTRGAAQRAQSMNNLRQIALAMHNYEAATRNLPPAFKADKADKPLLSWRVLILPYVEQMDLYEQFRLDEPWDSEHNTKLADKMPAIYQSPGVQDAAGMTHYLTVRGDKTAFPGAKSLKFADIRDGTSNTIMVVEAAKAVTWTKPDDFQIDEKDPKAGLTGLRPGGFLATFCDGSVRSIRDSIDVKVLSALFTRDGGEVIGGDY